MKIKAWGEAALISVVLAGCISTQEMPLAPNVVRIDTQARGILFTGQAVPQTMRAAAQATLARGYTHFKFADAGVQQGSVMTGAVSNYSGTINGAYGSGYVNATSSGFGTVTAIDAPTTNSAATVIMYHANDPEAKGAFEAELVLKQYR